MSCRVVGDHAQMHKHEADGPDSTRREFMQTHHSSQATSRRMRRRGPFLALAVVIAALAGACAPSPGGGFDIAIGGTLPLPPITAAPAFQGGDVLGCQLGFNTPGLNITGATASIPGINIDPGAGTITVPNIELNLPSIQVQLPSIVTCNGNLDLGAVDLPVNVMSTGVLNLATSQLTINATVTIPFAILGVPLPIVIPLSPIVVPL